MKSIGIEEHFLTAEVRQAWHAIGLEASDPSVAFHSGKQPIAACLGKNLHVTASGLLLPHYLQRTASLVGEDRLLFSTDFPHQYRSGRDARCFLDHCGLGETAKAGFAHGNWQRRTAESTARTKGASAGM